MKWTCSNLENVLSLSFHSMCEGERQWCCVSWVWVKSDGDATSNETFSTTFAWRYSFFCILHLFIRICLRLGTDWRYSVTNGKIRLCVFCLFCRADIMHVIDCSFDSLVNLVRCFCDNILRNGCSLTIFWACVPKDDHEYLLRYWRLDDLNLMRLLWTGMIAKCRNIEMMIDVAEVKESLI